MNDHAKSLLLKIGVGIILIIFTFFAFFGKEGTDNFVTENLYEALHPLKFKDILGLILFYGGALFLAGFKPQTNPKNSSKWNYITFAAIAAGIILIWI
jgi:hypothetical protein